MLLLFSCQLEDAIEYLVDVHVAYKFMAFCREAFAHAAQLPLIGISGQLYPVAGWVHAPHAAYQVYLLLAATPNTMHCALFAVGIGAGLRPSEILSMRWEDINMEDMTATIRGSKTAASAAAIPLTNLAGRELMRWYTIPGLPPCLMHTDSFVAQ